MVNIVALWFQNAIESRLRWLTVIGRPINASRARNVKQPYGFAQCSKNERENE